MRLCFFFGVVCSWRSYDATFKWDIASAEIENKTEK